MYVFIYLFIYAQAVYHEYAVNCRDSLQTNDPVDNILIVLVLLLILCYRCISLLADSDENHHYNYITCIL